MAVEVNVRIKTGSSLGPSDWGIRRFFPAFSGNDTRKGVLFPPNIREGVAGCYSGRDRVAVWAALAAPMATADG